MIPRALRHRDYALLWGGQTVSVVGDGFYTVAIALEALQVSDHASDLAYVQAARLAPNVFFLLFAGALVDRLPRRLVVLGADVARGGAVAAVAVFTLTHEVTIPILMALSAVVGLGDAFFYPAYRAIMPELLPGELLTQGNALNSFSRTIGLWLLGPAVAGVIVAVGGTSVAFVVDAGTFAVSAVCLIMMSHLPAPSSSGRSVAADAREGIRWTMGQRWLWLGILAAGVGNFAAFSPAAVTIPLIVRDVLHQGPAAYGAVFAASGLGGLLATGVAARLGAPRRRMSVIWVAWALAAVALAGVGVAPDVLVVAVCGALTFFGLTYGNLLWGALMQLAVPAGMLGRASSVDWLVSTCLSPLGLLTAGALAGAIGARETILAGAALAALSCLVVFIPGVRDPERPDFTAASPPELPGHNASPASTGIS